ncbi:VapC toxin [Oleiphilus messinensis]|uniref:VapC toxin n=1 Tax=Oleiphilus messinensis TaxID=141451 RepID=A0A1Y0I1F7_9GAMM|nr:type II toxin-antitoxin system MqsR family toxin [Oleiphilus messinensis]ARU54298.1 VapC toxin [Oleiphilus messinensis]
MEKRTPHCKLAIVKGLVEQGKLRVTRSAIEGATLLGLDQDDIERTIMNLKSSDFYKSMTTYADHNIWQDVYRPNTSSADIYLKLTVVEDVLVISFKEL